MPHQTRAGFKKRAETGKTADRGGPETSRTKKTDEAVVQTSSTRQRSTRLSIACCTPTPKNQLHELVHHCSFPGMYLSINFW
mmetsp:Transcript_33375/g.51860  ORF Transcript_33375/g.51860 Transcript_33375/m.51860 type:complete len:82 (-) Transcript_33375:984-1229(-)